MHLYGGIETGMRKNGAFGVAGTDGLLMQLTEIAEVLAGDYWERNAPELIGILADCYLSQSAPRRRKRAKVIVVVSDESSRTSEYTTI